MVVTLSRRARIHSPAVPPLTDMNDDQSGRSDAVLLRDGGEQAFTELYRRHAPVVHAGADDGSNGPRAT